VAPQTPICRADTRAGSGQEDASVNISTLRRVSVTAVALGAFACTPAAVAFSAPTLTSSAAMGGSEAGDHHQPMPTSPVAYELGETLAKLSGKKLEITFLAEIIPHHRAAIEMAKLELERGVDLDIRTHAENIIANQRHQIEQFTRWLHEWYGLTPEQAMEHVPDEARREMEKMEKETQRMTSELRHVGKGKKFDVEFVRHMIPHHSSGVIEFLEPQARAVHPQLRVAAASGIVTQESEIADFRKWLSGQVNDDGQHNGMPKGAADTGDGASQASATPLVAGGALLAATGAGAGAFALRRRRGAHQV